MRKEALLLFVFCCFSLVGVLNHEVWLDEAHHWLFARDSNSISELLFNMRYDGHPILWNLLLFGITRFTHDVFAMQFLHICIATFAVGIFLFHSPFTFFEKLLFSTGYFIIYEYSVISRNYALLMLFLFLALIFLSTRKYVWLGITLAFLANIHFFGLATGFVFVGIIAVQFFFREKETLSKRAWIGLAIFAGGVAISIWQITPPSDLALITNAQIRSPFERLGRTSAIFLKGFVPIPDVFNYRFWNTNVLMAISKPLCVGLSFLLFCLPAFMFRNRLPAFLFFYGCASYMILFCYLTDLNAVRYYGMIFIAFIAAFWLSRTSEVSEVPWLSKLKFKRDFNQSFLIIFLVIQSTAGIISYSLDVNRPFSESKHAAEFLLRNTQITDYIAAGCRAAPTSAYVGKPVYYLNLQQYGSFCFFNREIDILLEDNESVKRDSRDFVQRTGRPAFLITQKQLVLSSTDSASIRPLIFFENGMVNYENCCIYQVIPD